MVAPLLSCYLSGLDTVVPIRFHVRYGLPDPIGSVINDKGTIGEGCLRSKDHEEVRESSNGDTISRLQLFL